MEAMNKVNVNASLSSYTFQSRELKCHGAPLKIGHKGFLVENDEYQMTPPITPRDITELKCPGAPLRKGHKGFLPEPNDGF